jgi:hypothetical protein
MQAPISTNIAELAPMMDALRNVTAPQ